MHYKTNIDSVPNTLPAAVNSRRGDRFSARRVLWAESSIKRVRSCGHHGVMPDGNVAVKLTGTGPDRRAGFSGVATCGSTWACPVCSQKIASQRALDLSAAVAAWQAPVFGPQHKNFKSPRGQVLMVTLTMRHKRKQALADLWDSLSHAWGKVTSGSGWKNDQAEYGSVIPRVVKTGERKGETLNENRIGFARVVETTHGANGWHVHIHALLFVGDRVTEKDAVRLADSMFGRWVPALTSKGLTAPSLDHGVDVKLVSAAGDPGALGKYFAKNVYSAAHKAGWEVAGGSGKKAGFGNRTPFQMLADIVAVGDADDLARWWEWEEASHNRRQLTWSAGLREFLALGTEKTDAEISEEDLGGDVVMVLTAAEFLVVRWYAEDLLDLVETFHIDRARAWVASLASLVRLAE